MGSLICVSPDRGLERECLNILNKTTWNVDWVQNGLIALQAIKVNQYDVVIIDDSLPLLSASELANQITSLGLNIPVIALVESPKRKKQIIGDFRAGLYTYLEKPLQPALFRRMVDEAYKYRQFLLGITEEKRSCLSMLGCGDIIGRSAAMLEVYRLLLQIMNSDVTVAIFGESGTGKEVVARFLHSFGRRKEMPFMAVNCAAIPNDLLESELFGYEKGAFTGAASRKKGRFEVAHEGTVFLDEIGDMSLPLQAKILKVIERGEFERVGGTDMIKVDVRLISATNQDLEKRIEEGKFREDLYHRINVFPIWLPPLRDRPEDISLLAFNILSKLAKKHDRNVSFIESDALDILSQKVWDGNVRVLENVIERAVLMADSPFLTAKDFNFAPGKDRRDMALTRGGEKALAWQNERHDKPITLKEVEKLTVMEALKRNNGNMSQSARELGISRMTLYRKIKEYEIEKDLG